MILVDTSVWVDHLRLGNPTLSQLLGQGQVSMHPMIIGELVCGNLHNRAQLLSLWRNLPSSAEASHEEAIYLLEAHELMGKGIGFIDLHLLASTQLSTHTRLWTLDKRVAGIAESLGIAFKKH